MRRHREAPAQPAGRVSQVPAADGKVFTQDACPRRAPAAGLDPQGIQREVLRFARGGGWRAHGGDPGADRRRQSQAQ